MDALREIQDQLDEYVGKVRHWHFPAIAPSCLILAHRHPFLSVSKFFLSFSYTPLTTPQPDNLETPFSKFSAINVVPGPQDIPLINAIVSERHGQLSALALQIAHVDSAIKKLAALRVRLGEHSAHVRQSLLAHQALMSPARRIPPEVLGEVFYRCLPKTPFIVPRDVESPMVLTRVCRHWRAVALSNPRLWSSVSVCLEKIVRDTSYRHGCEAWLARARSVSLSIRVLNDINWIAEDPTLVLSAVRWLQPRIAHCDDLWWHGPSLPTLFTPKTEIDLPLRRLHVTTHRDSTSISFPGPARHLRSASLQCLSYDLQSLDGILLPWDYLVELNMHFALFSSTSFIQLLTRCGRLHTLIVSCLCADDIQLGALRALAPGSITHPTLRRIEIKVVRAGLDALFNALTLPALEELDVCCCYRERDPWPHVPFMEMVARSRCALKRLTVRSNKDAVAHFGEYTTAMPGLAVFTSAPDPWPR